ncbi:hypothetical protein B0T22DRAFT_445358 [Podospora appendiculata]|uniref:Uncharacterized protein n=1 Tax=Podospora appendiculata TaxID=314037 RepID=A0AAE0WZU4_9PEZI|nr:hypothetical protein B0T22DRAFT_445358 [Podospora appendiculata]
MIPPVPLPSAMLLAASVAAVVSLGVASVENVQSPGTVTETITLPFDQVPTGSEGRIPDVTTVALTTVTVFSSPVIVGDTTVTYTPDPSTDITSTETLGAPLATIATDANETLSGNFSGSPTNGSFSLSLTASTTTTAIDETGSKAGAGASKATSSSAKNGAAVETSDEFNCGLTAIAISFLIALAL